MTAVNPKFVEIEEENHIHFIHVKPLEFQNDVDEILKRIPHATSIEYPYEGHSLHAEFPEAFVSDLVSFA